MRKLTLVSFMCRQRIVTAFLMLPYFDGKPQISSEKINELFMTNHKFTPTRGETISHM